MDWNLLNCLADARIISVDKGRNVLVLALDCANADHLSAPIQELRFFDYSITQDAELTGCTWHQHILTVGTESQTMELTVYAPSTRRKPPQRRFVFHFKGMEIIPQ